MEGRGSRVGGRVDEERVRRARPLPRSSTRESGEGRGSGGEWGGAPNPAVPITHHESCVECEHGDRAELRRVTGLCESCRANRATVGSRHSPVGRSRGWRGHARHDGPVREVKGRGREEDRQSAVGRGREAGMTNGEVRREPPKGGTTYQAKRLCR